MAFCPPTRLGRSRIPDSDPLDRLARVGRYEDDPQAHRRDDDELFERARAANGTRGLEATVHRAFEEVLALDARRRAVEQLLSLDGLDLDRPDVLARAWR